METLEFASHQQQGAAEPGLLCSSFRNGAHSRSSELILFGIITLVLKLNLPAAPPGQPCVNLICSDGTIAFVQGHGDLCWQSGLLGLPRSVLL